jgi:hypothetical protein
MDTTSGTVDCFAAYGGCGIVSGELFCEARVELYEVPSTRIEYGVGERRESWNE